MRQEVFVIHPEDNVATLVSEDGRCERRIEVVVNGTNLQIDLKDNVPFGHKFAIRLIPAGSQVIKYGYSIGTATRDIQPGQHVHIHNLESNRGRGDLITSGAREKRA